MPRFDSLVHVTRDGRWPNGKDDACWARVVAELDRAGVTRACLVGLAGLVDNEYILECARSDADRIVPVAGLDPSSHSEEGSVQEAVEALARQGFAALKLHPRLNEYHPLDPRCLSAMTVARDQGMVVFLDTLFRQRAHPTGQAADIVDHMAHACPETRIVLLHGGGPELLEVAAIVAQHPSLVLDLSYTILAYAGSSLDADIRWVMRRLDRRVVVGSDMPEFTPAEVFARTEELTADLSAEKHANITSLNLERLFPTGVPAWVA